MATENVLNISQNLQEERQRAQEKIFRIWLNLKLAKAPGSPAIQDLFKDLRDGRYLLFLLNVLTEKKLKPVKGNFRVHHLNNLTLALDVLKEYNIKLVGISNQSICDGDRVTTLGLSWSIIYRFQVLEAVKNEGFTGSAEKALLNWCNSIVENYSDADVRSFQPKRWKNGYTLNALIHAFKPELFRYEDLSKMDDRGRLKNALSCAHNNFNIMPLFQAEDFESDLVDSRTLVMYVSFLYEHFQTLSTASKDNFAETSTKLAASQKELEQFVKEKDESTLQPLSNVSIREVCKRYFEFKESCNDFDDMDEKISVTDSELQASVDASGNTPPELVNAQKDYEGAKENYLALRNRWLPFEEQIHSKLLELLAEELNQIDDMLAKYEIDEVKIQSFLDEEIETSTSTSSDYMKINEDILSNLLQMEPLMGFIQDLVQQIDEDSAISDSNKGIFKGRATTTKSRYDALLQALKSKKKRLQRREELEKQRQDDHKKQKESQELEFQAWHQNLSEMIDWLLQAEQKVGSYENKSENAENLKILIDDYQKMKEEFKKREPEKNALLVKGKKILANKNDDNLQMELNLVDDKWSTLERRLVNGIDRLQEKEEMEKENEADRRKEKELQLQKFQDWHKKLTDMINWLLKVEQDVSSYEKDSNDQQSLKSLIEQYQKTKEELKKMQPRKNKLLAQGKDISANQKILGEESNIEMEITLVEDQWSSLEQKLNDGMDRSQEQLNQQVKDSVDGMDNMLHDLTVFRNWLDLANQQLNAISDSTKRNDFTDLHQKEQGLKKLSADLDSRGPELDNFQQKAVELQNRKEADGTVKEKKAAVIESVEELTDEWSQIIDRIDAQFKSLYDLINSNLDENRTQIERSLSLVKETLSTMQNTEFDKQEMLNDCKRLSELDNELAKLKPPIKKLSQNVVAVNEMTVFAADEQQLLCESADVLQTDFEQSSKQMRDVKSSSKEKIVNYFKEEADKSKNRVDELSKDNLSFSTDEKDLAVLRDFLTCQQRLSNELKSEHFKLDDLEQYAEEVSAYDLLAAEDQVKIAGIINDALKPVEELRNETKLNFNSAYAVSMHIIKQQLRQDEEEMKKCTEKSENPQQQDFKHFNDVSNALLNIKKDKDVLNTLTSDLTALNEEVNQLDAAGIMASSDCQSVKQLSSSLLQDSMEVSENISLQEKGTERTINDFILKKLDEFRGWLPTVQKRSLESNEIGPELEAIKKQLHELTVIEQQASDKSCGIFGAEENPDVYDMMPETSKVDIAAAKEEWQVIDDWVQQRKKALEKAQDLWDEYRRNESDLSEYMRDNERQMQTWNQLDLNDQQSVVNHDKALSNVMQSMELRKSHVGKLTGIANQLLDIIGMDGPVSYNVLSEVADIHASWNNVLKQSIENGTKLKLSQEKLKKLEEHNKTLRQWVHDVDEVLKEFKDNNIDEKNEPLLPNLQTKVDEMGNMDILLTSANASYTQLSEDNDTKSHFTVDDMTLLNSDFDRVTNGLLKIKYLADKPPYLRWFYKRVFYR